MHGTRTKVVALVTGAVVLLSRRSRQARRRGRSRGRFRVLSVEEGARGRRATIEATVECDAVEKPVCVAELVVLTLS